MKFLENMRARDIIDRILSKENKKKPKMTKRFNREDLEYIPYRDRFDVYELIETNNNGRQRRRKIVVLSDWEDDWSDEDFDEDLQMPEHD